MSQLLIIGAGPAGVSAALYARRAGLSVTVLYKGTGALKKVKIIENYYGFPEPISGAELIERGIEGAKRLGVEFVEEEVLSLALNDTGDGFVAKTKTGTYEGDAAVLAAGASRASLPLQGLRELEGRGVSYCAICDAFFFRGKSVAVIGSGAYALHEAEVLAPHASEIHILTNGEEETADFSSFIVHREPIVCVDGSDRVAGVTFASGGILPVQGVFVAIGTAGSIELGRKLGAFIDVNSIRVDENMATNVPGLFAAGDCTGGLLQVAKAVYEGAKAGLSAVVLLRERAKKKKNQ